MKSTNIRSPRKLTNIPYSINSCTITNTKIPYNCLAFNYTQCSGQLIPLIISTVYELATIPLSEQCHLIKYVPVVLTVLISK